MIDEFIIVDTLIYAVIKQKSDSRNFISTLCDMNLIYFIKRFFKSV